MEVTRVSLSICPSLAEDVTRGSVLIRHGLTQ